MNGSERDGIITCWKDIGVSGDSSCPRLAQLVHCRNCEEYNKAGRRLLDREIPEGFLKQWTASIADEKEKEPGESVSVIVFRIRGEWLALKTLCLQETVSARPVHEVPSRSNSVFRGLVNVNGELLLCMSAADVLEKGSESRPAYPGNKPHERMLVVRFDGERYVFPVDEVLGVYRVATADLSEPPVTMTKSPAAFVKAILDFKEKKIGVLDENNFHDALRRSLLR